MKRILLSLLVLGMFLLPNNASACKSTSTYWCDNYDDESQCAMECETYAESFCGSDILLDSWSTVYYEPACSTYEACACEVLCTDEDCPLA